MAKLHNETITDERNIPQLVQNADFRVAVGLNLIDGVVQAVKFGRIHGVQIADCPVDVIDAGGLYAGFPLGAAETMQIVSSNVNDTLLGTGARTVLVSGLLDAEGLAMPDVEVEMNGTTPVLLDATQTYYRANLARVRTVGSTGENVGTITLTHTTTTANIFATIAPGNKCNCTMAYTVPANKTLLIGRGWISLTLASGGLVSANVAIMAREYLANAPFVALRNIEITQASPYRFENAGFFVLPARMDFTVQVASVSANNANIASEYDGLLIDNPA